MLIDVPRFVETERGYWEELERILMHLESDPQRRMDLSELQRFHYLYDRTASDLGKIGTFAAEKEIRSYLESLVGRAYAEIHESRRSAHRFAPLRWFLNTFPATFRAHINAFGLSVAVTLIGVIFGGAMLSFDRDSKSILLPFSHLQISPTERVRQEEQSKGDRLAGRKSSFSSFLMTHNTKVSILTMAMGITYGIGTFILLFFNGVILGAVTLDYVLGGQTTFLVGWLLPHGSVEIPAILIAGQAGFVLARTLIGGPRNSLRTRLRLITSDLVTLIGGVAVLLVWAGIIEAFLSQYHEPVVPYAAKIGFGMLQLMLLFWFLLKSGGMKTTQES